MPRSCSAPLQGECKARGAALWPCLLLLLLAAGSPSRLLAAVPPPEAGSWLTQNHASVIEIAPCGSGLCGRIAGVSLDSPSDPEPIDKWGRPQCSETIIQMPRFGADHRWHGTILDPRSGANWTAELWRAADGLHLRGYVALELLGATQVWTPYHGSIGPLCHFRRPR